MTKLKIEGMTCNHCVKAVTEALGEVPGVDKVVEVSLEQKPGRGQRQRRQAALIAAVAEAGYEARVA